MGLYLFLIIAILTLLFAITIYITGKNKREDTYTDLETDEWYCPECGFHVQVGDKCIYCDTSKP